MTIPIEIQIAGIPECDRDPDDLAVRPVRRQLQFTYDFTYDEAQQWVINRLSQLPSCPTARQPEISPAARSVKSTATGCTGPPDYTVIDLKTIQDWVLQRRFKAVPGVIDVTGWGGKTKTYESQSIQQRLVDYGLTLPQVLQASEQHQHQCRRQDRQYRRASRCGARRRPDPFHGRHSQYHVSAQRRHRPVLVEGYRHGHRRSSNRGWASPARIMTTTSSRASC